MGKTKAIGHLTNLLRSALRHKIGSVVNSEELYADKYRREYLEIMRNAQKLFLNFHWNAQDLVSIRELLKKKLLKELEKKDFLDDTKYNLVDEEVDRAMDVLMDSD